LDHLSDTAGAEADLAHAVSRDASHRKAAKRLKDIYREQGRTDEYLTMLEMEAAAVMRVQDAARIEEIKTETEQPLVRRFNASRGQCPRLLCAAASRPTI